MEGTEVRKLTELEARHWWYRERRHLVARGIRGLTPGTALDVGAAGGGNTRVLQRAGWTAAALEDGAEGGLGAAEGGPPARWGGRDPAAVRGGEPRPRHRLRRPRAHPRRRHGGQADLRAAPAG